MSCPQNKPVNGENKETNWLTLERPRTGRSVFIGIHGHSSHKKNREVQAPQKC